MALLKIRCPECNAGLKSPTGFTVGQTVCCPKCETYFAVEEPEEEDDAPKKKPVKAVAEDDEDEEDYRPKKKKKKQRAYDEDEEGTRSYKNSPLRYAILGVLVIVMLVLGYFLYDKRMKEREAADANNSSDGGAGPAPPPPPPPQVVGMPGGKFPGKQPGGKLPGGKQPGGKQPGGPGFDPLGGFFDDPNPAEAQALTQKFKSALVGTWTADLGDGVTQELTYTANGTYTAKLTGPNPATASGKYTVQNLVGTKGVKVQLDAATGAQTVVATFGDGELEHPTLLPGVTGTFRKK